MVISAGRLWCWIGEGLPASNLLNYTLRTIGAGGGGLLLWLVSFCLLFSFLLVFRRGKKIFGPFRWDFYMTNRQMKYAYAL